MKSSKYGFADFEVDLRSGILRRHGYEVPLQDQPFRLLALLVQHAGMVVAREEIQAHLWPQNTYVEFDKSLRVAVSKLREALRDSATEPKYVETIPRRGYRFIAPVVDLTPPSASTEVSTPGSETVQASNASEPTPTHSTPPKGAVNGPWWLSRLSSGTRIAALSALLAIFAIGSVYLVRSRIKPIISPPVAAHPAARRSVAVIGLRNLTGSQEDRWLSTGLAEMLSTELSSSDQLRVISGEEVARAGLAGPPPSTPSHETLIRYGHQLGADMILLGSYAVTREKGSSVPSIRLDLRLENLTSDAGPITLVETGPAKDLFPIVSSTGKELRQQFGLGDVSGEGSDAVRRTLPANPAAARYFVEGLVHLRNFDPVAARDLLQKATQLEPSHLGTHQALAEAWHAMGYDNEAQTEAARAVKLGEALPRQELLNLRGELALYSADWPQAIDLFHSLVALYPDNIDYGVRLEQAQSSASQLTEALATLQSLRRDGRTPADTARIELEEALAHLRLGNFRESVAASDRATQIASSLDNKLIRARALWIKASALERMSDAQGSLAASSEAQTLYRAAGDKQGLGLALMMSGDVLYDKGQYAEARSSFEASLEFFRQIGHTRNMGILLERIGNSYFAAGALPESRKNYEASLANYRQMHWDAGVASIIGNIANVQDTEGDIAGALKSNAEGLALFEKTGQKRGTASTLANMGSLELERGNLDRAAADFDHAASADRQISYARGLAFALTGQGDVLTARNDLPAAMRSYQLALKAIEGKDEPEALTPLKISLGVLALESGNATQAATYLQQAVDLSLKVPLKDQNHTAAAFALAALSRSLLAQGKTAEAAATANRAITESHLQPGPQARLVAALALARTKSTQGNIPAATELLRSTAQSARHYGYAPLDLEARILLAHTQPASSQRNHQLKQLSAEASTKNWNQLAAKAQKP